ncbi:helix-turn-helix transcriptional regulator [Lewinella sp. JB7]|uniref:ArsR/SmtB family transcription factor n=1 Tax=Lewinella sp. JB7 TaxID=2962887 RepID=UPI0020C99BF2|nr:metalloregulator ArsR/SmtB family transcription factor [Lewinella sp. JB7]MCP9234526.1 metalloregulator ArsR/SmtB family transcription factor [Lewinella sp. JB7]
MLDKDQHTQPESGGDNVNIDPDQLRRAVLLLRAVNHDLRQAIIDLLKPTEKLTVTDIFVAMRIEQSVASQHLAILRKADIVTAERDGKYIYYSLDREKLAAIVRLIDELNR